MSEPGTGKSLIHGSWSESMVSRWSRWLMLVGRGMSRMAPCADATMLVSQPFGRHGTSGQEIDIFGQSILVLPPPSMSQVRHYALPSAPSASGLQTLLQFGLDNGRSVGRCLSGTGLAWKELAAPDLTVTVEQEIQLIRNLVRGLGHIPGLGLQAGLRFRLAGRGVW